MKKFSWVRINLTAAVLTAALTAGAGAASLGTGRVEASALRLRSEANTESSVLTMVYGGQTVDVLEKASDGWYKVSANGKVGYMSAEYLTVSLSAAPAAGEQILAPEAPAEENAAPAEETAAEQADEAAGLGNGKVTTQEGGPLNLRAGCSTSTNKIGSIPNGTVLALEDSRDGWYQVTFRGVTGYVSGDYIKPTEEEVTPAVSGSGVGAQALELAMQYLGCPYVYGAAGPKSFDCSGFTYYIYGKLGYSIYRTASTQFNGSGVPVSRENLQPGDLVFFREPGSSKSATHVGIYIGNGDLIHASSSRSGAYVRINNLSEKWYATRYVGAKRIA